MQEEKATLQLEQRPLRQMGLDGTHQMSKRRDKAAKPFLDKEVLPQFGAGMSPSGLWVKHSSRSITGRWGKFRREGSIWRRRPWEHALDGDIGTPFLPSFFLAPGLT